MFLMAKPFADVVVVSGRVSQDCNLASSCSNVTPSYRIRLLLVFCSLNLRHILKRREYLLACR